MPKVKPSATSRPGVLAVIGSELLGLFLDDGFLAAGIVVWVLVAWFGEARHVVAGPIDGLLFAAGLAAVLGASAARQVDVTFCASESSAQ